MRTIKLALLLPLVGPGCAAQATLAPFPARPDTVVAGDLRGPFDGRVLDVESGKPVDGAAVMAAWAFEQGRGLSGPAGAHSLVVETDADGRYRVPALDIDGRGGRIGRFTLVVYKRGYIGWRSDRRFEDSSARHDFAQTGTVVQLRRLPADVSHVRHLAFLGAGGPLLSRMAWELPLAAQEALPPPVAEAAPEAEAEEAEEAEKLEQKPKAPPLDAGVLLSGDELKRITRYGGEFEVERLPDVPSAPNYDSLHFRAVGKPETWDAAARVFKLTPEEADKQFDVLMRELPNAKPGREVGTRSLRAVEGGILAVATLDRPRGVVLLFSCGKSLCGDHQRTVAIVKRMAGRFDELGGQARPEAPTPGETPAPASPPDEGRRLRLKPPELRR